MPPPQGIRFHGRIHLMKSQNTFIQSFTSFNQSPVFKIYTPIYISPHDKIPNTWDSRFHFIQSNSTSLKAFLTRPDLYWSPIGGRDHQLKELKCKSLQTNDRKKNPPLNMGAIVHHMPFKQGFIQSMSVMSSIPCAKNTIFFKILDVHEKMPLHRQIRR